MPGEGISGSAGRRYALLRTEVTCIFLATLSDLKADDFTPLKNEKFQ